MVARRILMLATCLAVLGSLSIAGAATVTVFKEGTDLAAGGALDAAFSGAGPANVSSQTVNDTFITGNTAVAYTIYGSNASGSPTLLFKFDVSAIGPGAKIYKAQLRLRAGNGNGTVSLARITTHDWLETTACLAGPDAPAFPNKTWGPDSNAYFSAADYGAPVNFESAPSSAAWCVKDVTADVQAFVDGTLPNYGWYVNSTNHGIQMSEHATDGERPALFVSWDPNAAPNPVTDLVVSTTDWFRIDLQWTAPSDSPPGPIHHYDIRMSTSPIDDSNFAAASPVTAPAAGAPGTVQTLTVDSLAPLTTYYFAIKTHDATGLVSPISNNGTPLAGTTGPMDVTPPAQVSLTVAPADVYPNHAIVRWTAVGDDGMTGLAAGYDVRYSTSPILDDAAFAAATPVTGLAAPKAPGSAESAVVHGLTPGTTYYFAIKARDEVPNKSPLSGPVSIITDPVDVNPPTPVTNLAVTAGHIRVIGLTWTAPADVGTAGLAGYDIRYSLNPISDANWDAATPVADEPVPGPAGAGVLFLVTGLAPDTTYYFAMKSFDWAEPANVSLLSNVVSGRTIPLVQPVSVVNPWIVNDRVADTHNLNTMATTYVNAYTPNGVVAPATNEQKAISIYNNQKRRLHHWADEPPNVGGHDINDPTYLQNVFGWALCGRHACNGCTIAAAAGLGQRKIAVPGDWQMEFFYDGGWHLFHSMITFYVYTRGANPHIASCDEIKADNNLVLNAVAENRACPGYLLCGDTTTWEAGAVNSYSDGGSGVVTTRWSGNMNLRLGQSFSRTWESWLNQHPPRRTDSDGVPGLDPPYHHHSPGDWKDYVNFPYWEPYTLTADQRTAIGMVAGQPCYRRWANGTDVLAPDFRSPGYQALLEASSNNIATFYQDGTTPDLHGSAVNTLGQAVFKISVPYYITDATFSGTFVKATSNDVCRVYVSSNGTAWTQVYDAPVGTTTVTNQSLRTSVYNLWSTWYIKIELKGTAALANAGVSNLVVNTTFEHNKGAMAYLDKGVNHITVTFDNPAELTASGAAFKVVYKWKEYDGTGWTIAKEHEQYILTSPATFTITTGGSKVPRTESITMEVSEPPFDPAAPAAVTNLAVESTDSGAIGLTWTATGDNNMEGQASLYDIRYALSPIVDDAGWVAATQVTGEPGPAAAGTVEHFVVTGLQDSTTYWFAIKVGDKIPNWSGLSNSPSGRTPDPDIIPPAWVGNLVARPSKSSGAVDLTWTASGDDENTGTAKTYYLRYSTSPIAYDDTDASWDAATPVAGLPAPKVAGSAEMFTVTGLTGGTQYYFALKVADERPNLSEVSNCSSSFASVLGEKVLQTGTNGYTGCRDSYTQSSAATTNYGTYERMRVTGYADLSDTQRGYIKFDLSSIPAGTVIRSAKLYLYSYDTSKMLGSSGYYAIHRITRNWNDAVMTWNIAETGVNWSTAGGDFDATADALAAKKTPKVPSWYEWDLTARVQEWIDTPAANNGWLVKAQVETSHIQDQFYQIDTAAAQYRPKLIVSDCVEPVTGDINGDGGVDVVDLLYFVDSFGYSLGERGYDPKCDLEPDDIVDVVDLLTFVEVFGT